MQYYKGWLLTDQARDMILAQFLPTYQDVRCDHVTLDLCEEDDPAPDPANIRAYGMLDMEGYQILAVTVDGQLFQPRKDRMFHVTISHLMQMPSSHAGLILKEHQAAIKPIQSFMVLSTPFVRPLGRLTR